MTRSRAIPFLPKSPPRGAVFRMPLSQAEDSTQPSGLENRMSGTARPRVRIRDHRPGFHL